MHGRKNICDTCQTESVSGPAARRRAGDSASGTRWGATGGHPRQRPRRFGVILPQHWVDRRRARLSAVHPRLALCSMSNCQRAASPACGARCRRAVAAEGKCSQQKPGWGTPARSGDRRYAPRRAAFGGARQRRPRRPERSASRGGRRRPCCVRPDMGINWRFLRFWARAAASAACPAGGRAGAPSAGGSGPGPVPGGRSARFDDAL